MYNGELIIIFAADLRLLKLAMFIHYHLYFITIRNGFQYFWGIDKIKFLCYNKNKFIAGLFLPESRRLLRDFTALPGKIGIRLLGDTNGKS